MPADLNKIQQIAGFFRNSDPKQYAEFLRCMREWTDEVTVAVTEASNDKILQAQGRAQQQRKVLQVFTEVRGA